MPRRTLLGYAAPYLNQIIFLRLWKTCSRRIFLFFFLSSGRTVHPCLPHPCANNNKKCFAQSGPINLLNILADEGRLPHCSTPYRTRITEEDPAFLLSLYLAPKNSISWRLLCFPFFSSCPLFIYQRFWFAPCSLFYLLDSLFYSLFNPPHPPPFLFLVLSSLLSSRQKKLGQS
jgi:hypothetical protein